METIKEVIRIRQEVVLRESRIKLQSPEKVYKVAMEIIGDEDREVFLVFSLNTKLDINAIHKSSMGSVDATIVHPREIFKSAILNNATSIIVAHNHPSYDVNPSIEDRNFTKRLIEAGIILGIPLNDHLIVSPNTFFSFRESEPHLFCSFK